VYGSKCKSEKKEKVFMKKIKLLTAMLFTVVVLSAEVWDGTDDLTWLTSAPGANEYTLTTAEELAGLAKVINENLFDLSQKTIKLGANIMLNDTTNWQNWGNSAPANRWLAMGTTTRQFKSVFDGNGYTITGVYVSSTGDHQGLFGEIAPEGAVKNLVIVDSYVKGKGFVGILAGINRGEIENCNVSGNVYGTFYYVGGLVGRNSGVVTNSHSAVTVIGDYHSVGGLAGDNYGTIKKSSAKGYVISEEDPIGAMTGGLVGVNYGLIDNCYAETNITTSRSAGGLVGENTSYADASSTARITNSHAIGNINGNGGGLAGSNSGSSRIINCYTEVNISGNGGGFTSSNYGTIINCYSTGNIGGDGGGFVRMNSSNGVITNSYYNSETSGKTDTGKGEPQTTAQMQSADFVFMLNFYSYNLSVQGWIYSVGKYPTLGDVLPEKPDFSGYFDGGNGTQNSPYLITTKKQLEDFAYWANLGYTYEGDYIKLGADITLNDTTNFIYWDQTLFAPTTSWTPIGTASLSTAFRGTFDGDNRVISGMYIKDTSYSPYLGLFRLIAEGGIVKNLGLRSSYIESNRGTVGMLAYSNRGTVVNCYSTGKITGESYIDVGGLVSVNYGTIDNCYTTVDVVGVKGGGLVYYNAGTIKNSYATGNVTGNNFSDNAAGACFGGLVGINYVGATIANSYAIGNVDGIRVGGLVGNNYDYYSTQESKIINCYAIGSVTVRNSNGEGGGLVANKLSTNRHITNSYYDSQTSKQTDNDGRGEPRTTAQMKTQSTFVDWDFENIWNIDPSINNGYPYLDLRGTITPIREIKKSGNRYGIKFANNIVSEKAEISVILPNNEKVAEMKIVIYDNIGNIVYDGNETTWNLTNKTGRKVANGTYLVLVEAKGVSGKTYRYSAKLGVSKS
jgi:hypothetical protein